MQNHRESLLGSVPSATGPVRQLYHHPGDRESVREGAAQGQFDELRSLAYNRTWYITDRYCGIGDGVDSIDDKLHDLWHIYFEMSRHIPHESSDQDRLVLGILRIQGRGPLSRRSPGLYGIDIARTTDGTLWNDLPFLVTDMTDYCINNFAQMGGTQRLNFAYFLAKLASTRISKDRLCQIALFIFRNTFEEGQCLSTPDDPDDEKPTRSITALSIASLLPAACAWIEEAATNLILLSEVSWNDCPSTIGWGGPLFIQSELGQRSPTGFTPWRWMYWLKRLHEIQEDAAQAGEKRIEDDAAKAIRIMVYLVEERGSEILRAYEAGGAGLHQDKHLLCLKTVLESPSLRQHRNRD
ncbi:hypothetical protein P175DRAFT_0504700 [Aspergillus ochraceoroseus IBT 24754]|uniref:Uncharacterized protein n=2 Tax=Aspergillus ochraceoroseus TaxID=138278 RepID=A0A2T5LM98_9EURO|nr:uncharacterized protein P175DRAFT_0504700 [Aspergillus ochraceoroseus IBT 24754]KKK25544.1 hypothetical protein AOCH_001367 [Aspergillus ochraceoroseus]PTU17404.1 hypothetical protein P175DRAFT_0504700 [Aspergillus ochraceoroseus IBT 24754]